MFGIEYIIHFFAEIYRVLKPGGRLLIADMISSKASAGLTGLPAILLHHGLQIDASTWLAMLKKAGFPEAIQLERRFSAVGFVRATKGNDGEKQPG